MFELHALTPGTHDADINRNRLSTRTRKWKLYAGLVHTQHAAAHQRRRRRPVWIIYDHLRRGGGNVHIRTDMLAAVHWQFQVATTVSGARTQLANIRARAFIFSHASNVFYDKQSICAHSVRAQRPGPDGQPSRQLGDVGRAGKSI